MYKNLALLDYLFCFLKLCWIECSLPPVIPYCHSRIWYWAVLLPWCWRKVTHLSDSEFNGPNFLAGKLENPETKEDYIDSLSFQLLLLLLWCPCCGNHSLNQFVFQYIISIYFIQGMAAQDDPLKWTHVVLWIKLVNLGKDIDNKTITN